MMPDASLVDWPEGATQAVSACPACGSRHRMHLYSELADWSFHVAPGRWSMVRCTGCQSAYLTPRPTEASIGMAYANYYTHESADARSTSTFTRLRRSIASSYGNHKFGTNFAGQVPIGHLIAYLMPRLRRYLDVRYGRHLGKPATSGARLLDVGCGNGEFLACATAMGWDAHGIDVDPQAVAAACSAGYSAQLADLSEPSLRPASYAQITMSHVIEHLACPAEHLKNCLQLLVPGGRLWLQTPNVNSLGHRIFGAGWRGLEAPRHWVLFSRHALRHQLENLGFVDIEFRTHPAVPLFIWEESRQICKLMQPNPRAGMIRRLMQTLPAAILADYWSIVSPDSAEFITCTARRPGRTLPT